MKSLEIFETMPNGWKKLQGATTGKKGFEMIYNGQSIFIKSEAGYKYNPERKIALLRK